MAFVLGIVIGFILGACVLDESEAKKAKEGKYTIHDDVVYKYVKVNTDGLEDD